MFQTQPADMDTFGVQYTHSLDMGGMGASLWSEGPRIVAHYVNCIPMTAEG